MSGNVQPWVPDRNLIFNNDVVVWALDAFAAFLRVASDAEWEKPDLHANY